MKKEGVKNRKQPHPQQKAHQKQPSKFVQEKDEDLSKELIDDQERNLFMSDQTAGITEIHQENWKPARHHSYETMALADSQLNCKIRPCGFRPSGRFRKVKNTCLVSKLKTKCRLRGRNPKLAVCITMYNENEAELKNTLTGVLHNYNEMRLDKDLDFRKEDFVVFLICDGFDRIPKSFREYAFEKQFFDMDVLQQKNFMEKDRDGNWRMKDMRDIMDPGVKPQPNIIHMFQVQTWDFGLTDDILKGKRLNFIFAIKQRNDGKINSHKWFFQGLCKYLKPDLCMMLDIGTQPSRHSIYKLYKYMVKHDQCGGCCGEIEVDLSDSKEGVASYLIKAAQFFEYKMGHAPDKANESFFGFNSVLPGAYSMFRWKAIKGEPLDEFFKSVNRQDLPSCAEANEFLAEDRVMCLQIYIKKKAKYHLCFIPDAKAYTDAPDSLAVLIKQRRRWMNGATFGTIKVISNFVHMVSCRRTKHSCARQFGIFFFLIYYFLTFLFQFFTVGSMYASITIFLKQSVSSMLETSGWSQIALDLINAFFDYFYIGMVVMALIVSLTTPVDRGVVYFKFLMVVFGILLVSTMVGIISYLINTGFNPLVMEYNENRWPRWQPRQPEQHHFSYLVLSGCIMCGVFLIPIILRPLDFLMNVRAYVVGLFTYIFMMPTFINIMQIYAMCNLHDISWGNRPAQGSGQGVEALALGAGAQEKLKQDYQVFRAHFLYSWLILNALFGGLSTGLVNGQNTQVINDGISFLDGFALFIASLVVFKFMFGLIYYTKWNCRIWTNPYYRKSKVDVAEEFKRIRKDRNGAFSTDEDDDDEHFGGRIETNAEGQKIFVEDVDGELKLQTTNRDIDDSDNDDMEFEDAQDEEKEDIVLQSQRKSRAKSNVSQFTSYLRKPDNDVVIESVISIDHDNPNNPNGGTTPNNQNGLSYKFNKDTIERKSEMQPGRSSFKKQVQNNLKDKSATIAEQKFFEGLGQNTKSQSNIPEKKAVVFSLGQAFNESEMLNKKSVRFAGGAERIIEQQKEDSRDNSGRDEVDQRKGSSINEDLND